MKHLNFHRFKKKIKFFFQSDLILIVRLIDNQQYDKAFTQLKPLIKRIIKQHYKNYLSKLYLVD